MKLPSYDRIAALLAESPVVQAWIMKRVFGLDSSGIHSAGLNMIIRDLAFSACDRDGWRVSESRWSAMIIPSAVASMTRSCIRALLGAPHEHALIVENKGAAFRDALSRRTRCLSRRFATSWGST